MFAPQVKNAYKTFTTEIAKFEGEKNSSLGMILKAICSAQAIENLAMHAKSRVTPYKVPKAMLLPLLR